MNPPPHTDNLTGPAHLRTGRDITPQIAANTGLEPVEARLEHYDTLPERISRWLTQNTNALTPV